MKKLPILYSLQHCPYAMRARTALIKANHSVLIRSITLSNKPQEMLQASPKGSVPVLIVQTHDNSFKVILEESLEIMLWALGKNDPANLLYSEDPQALPLMISAINEFEDTFVPLFEAYSCSKRYHNDNLNECREACMQHLNTLERTLTKHTYILSENESLVDIALMPFIRKFSKVERAWFRQSPYPKLRQWLNHYLQSPMFSKVMERHELWLENRKDILFAHLDS